MTAISSASAGMISAAARFDQASVNVIKAANSGPADLGAAVVDQVSAKTAFDASATVAKVVDQMSKRALDILV